MQQYYEAVVQLEGKKKHGVVSYLLDNNKTD